MKSFDYRCEQCNYQWEMTFNSVFDIPPVNPQCPSCRGILTHIKYSKVAFDVAQGKAGNASSKYETNVAYHPSVYGKYKGTKV